MSASQPAYFHLQEFADNGAPLVGGRLYTYSQGTTSIKIAYADPNGVTPQTYTADGLGGQYIALNARGELVTPLYLTGGAYDIVLKRADGSTVWTRRAEPTGDLKVALAAPTGSSLINFIQAGVGAVVMSVQSMLRGTIDPRQFGAVMDGVTNDRAAMQKAMQSKGSGAPVSIRLPAGANMKIVGTLYLPPRCLIDLNGSTITGDGVSTLFETGYWSGGAVVSNHAQAPETQIVYSSGVFNGQITNCDRAFNLYNFCEASRVEYLRITACNQAWYARRCFYGSFKEVIARDPGNGALYPCYHFFDAVNAIGLDHVFTNGYSVGWLVSGSKDNFSGKTCGAEGCSIGVQIDGSSSGLKFDNWYLENNSTTALSFSSGGNHFNVDVGNCFFNNTPTAISASTIVSGIFRRTNRLGGAVVDLATNFSNQLVVEIPIDLTATNAVAALPSNYLLGDSVTVDYVKTLYSTVDGFTTTKGIVEGGIIPTHYSGDTGRALDNVIPFCVSNLTATTLTIDTKINYRDGTFIGVQLNILDSGLQQILGTFAGATATSLVKPVPLSVLATNNGGFFRFTVTGLVAATAFSGRCPILG